MKTHLILLAFAATLATAATAYAHPDRMMTSGPDFAQAAAMGNNYEILTSRLALQRSHDPAVRNLAQRMINDHTKAEKDLKATLAAEGTTVRIDGQLDEAHQKMYKNLKDTNAGSFNYQYIADQASAHAKAIHLFDVYSKSGSDAELRDLARKTLPTLRHHQEMVQRISMTPGYSWH